MGYYYNASANEFFFIISLFKSNTRRQQSFLRHLVNISLLCSLN